MTPRHFSSCTLLIVPILYTHLYFFSTPLHSNAWNFLTVNFIFLSWFHFCMLPRPSCSFFQHSKQICFIIFVICKHICSCSNSVPLTGTSTNRLSLMIIPETHKRYNKSIVGMRIWQLIGAELTSPNVVGKFFGKPHSTNIKTKLFSSDKF